MTEWITLVSVVELTPGMHLAAALDDTQIVVFNLDGQYSAIENICSHDGGQLTGGAIEGDHIICPRHGAHFCIRTGAALSAPAYEPINTFPLRIENGMVQVRDNRWD
jgi:3-phenylpropionate/trans-cinnamate dioxygenase ferredoxin subunit